MFLSGIAESTDVERIWCYGYRRINIFIDDILESIDVEGFHVVVIGE